MRTIDAVLLALMLCVQVGLADDPPPPPAPPTKGDGAERLMEHLRTRDPARFEELVRLRQEDPDAFRQAIRQRVGNLGEGRDWDRGRRPRPEGEGGQGPEFGPPGRPPNKEFVQQVLARLAERDPDRAAELTKLLEKDPDAFRNEVRHMLFKQSPLADDFPVKGNGDRDDAEKAELRQLRERFAQAGDEDTRGAVRAEMRERLGTAFDGEAAEQEKRLELLEIQITTMRERLATRRAQRDQLIQEKVDKLLQTPVEK